ncbi:DUF1573 domain-containing protein [Flavicella marina]|uniref:DUF1573 domain-containing protein n=1 Tax=Flavicella marina TaxID=1475951 RepID=UPI0012647A7D|nr:DUF1573 domain-containing protein [Flavicella marina]
MKKSIFFAVFFIGLFSMNAQTAKPVENFDANAPAFKFNEEVIDYGKIEKGADGAREFTFTNVGGSPLIISATKGSCGCTVPTYDKEPIMPGETGTIRVKYDTKRIGRFSKSVTITSNATESKKVVRIKGEVLQPKE